MVNQTGILKKFRKNFCSFEEIWLFTQIFFSIIVLPIMLRLFTIPRLMRMLTPRNMKVYQDLEPKKLKTKAVKFTDYILSRNFLMSKNTCLKRSIVLYHFLRKLGIDVHICFGVRYNERLSDRETKKRLEGHAWLLYHGNIFLERNVEITKIYTLTYCFPEKMEQIG
ncbi:MAG: lasso peptide biosynthesis B2 protein [Candidatus Loosdrechtia sp.]|uniref:lasso peptide biosynthesis B2 protein n=1 Tax=Candidatus Loosdrechtia sp. TaxID=3101272 RepID=UPI003A6AC2AA|nr:MAG: lasso peptide biosynthesis B2 protein [Candidatus Jettenia sp. AMX2]